MLLLVSNTFLLKKNIVFQFHVKNTLNDQLLENVHVDMEVDESSGFKVDSVVPAESIGFGEVKPTFVKVDLPPDATMATATFSNILKFDVKDIDLDSGTVDEESGVPEEYQLEDLEVAVSDFMKKNFVADFPKQWESFGEDGTAIETFSLSTVANCAEAVKEIIDFLGMQPCERSENVPAKRSKHILYLSGMAVGGIPILARVRMKANPSGGVSMELTVRSSDGELSSQVASAMYS